MYICYTIIMEYIILLFWKVCSLERITEICRSTTPRSGAIHLISVILLTDTKIILIDNKRVINIWCDIGLRRQLLRLS